MALQIVYPFRLPKGYLDGEGKLHQEGKMRLATAKDELECLADSRVQADGNYMSVLLLSRVVTALGTLEQVTPQVMEGLFLSDMEFLQQMYESVNRGDKPQIRVRCPHCGKEFLDTINFQQTE